MAACASNSTVLWRQVWALSAMIAAILFSFMVYGIHQPKILADLGFVQLSSSLSLIQGVSGAVIEPVVGGLSDRILRRTGSRLPQITVGVTLAGAIFVITAGLLPADLPASLRWLFPGLMMLWSMAMIAIRGPIVALLRQFAPTNELPIANAILILVLGLVGALQPVLGLWLQQLNATLAFLLGAIVLLLGATLLYRTVPQHSLAIGNPPNRLPSMPASYTILPLALIFLIGAGAALEINALPAVFPQRLHAQLTALSPEAIGSMLLLIAALSANPLGWLTGKIGAIPAMQLGLGAIVVLMAGGLLTGNAVSAVGILLGFGLAFGLVFISMIPFCLSIVPPERAGLSTGLFFGGGSLAITLFPYLNSLLNSQGAVGCVLGVAIVFSMTAVCLEVCQRRRDTQSAER